MSKKDQEKIRRLSSENRRLRRENEYLRHRLSMDSGKISSIKSETSAEKILRESMRMTEVSRLHSYFGYLTHRFRFSLPFRLYDRTRFAVRGFSFVTKMVTLLVWIFTFLGVGAQFLFAVGAVMIFLPAATVASFVTGIVGYFVHKKWNRKFSEILSVYPGRIYIVFISKERTSEGKFPRFLRELSEDGTVFLVSHSFSACGFSGARSVEDRIFRIHISFYFSFARQLDFSRVVKIY